MLVLLLLFAIVIIIVIIITIIIIIIILIIIIIIIIICRPSRQVLATPHGRRLRGRLPRGTKRAGSKGKSLTLQGDPLL